VPIRGLITGGRLNVFAVEADGLLARVRQLGFSGQGGWSAWEEVGPGIKGSPFACQNADGHLEVFALGPDGRLGHAWLVGAEGWSNWEPLGPAIASAPRAFQNASGHLEVFAIDTEGRLGHVWQLEPSGRVGWSNWEPLAAGISGDPGVFPNADGHLEVFAIGPDGKLGHVWQLEPDGGTGWGEWIGLGPAITGNPVAFQNADGHLEVFARGPGGVLGNVWQLDPNGSSGWSEWKDMGPEISGDPAVFQNSDGRLELFAIDSDGLLGHTWQLEPNGVTGWSAWEQLGPELASDPVLARSEDGQLELFAIDSNAMLGHRWQLQDGAGWSDWEALGAVAPGHRPAVCQARRSGDEPEQRRRPRAGSADTVSADYCVIGAGPAGITVSEGLIRAGASVVLLESGGLDEDLEIQELSRGAVHGPIVKGYWKYLFNGRRRQVGGSASGWGRGVSMPFRTIELERRPWVALSGWPLSAQELAPYQARAEATFDVGAFGEPRPDGSLVRLSYRHPPDPQLFRTTFLELLRTPRFQAELGATALELRMQGERVQSVRCIRADGSELRVDAGTVVLSAGGVENARMLLLNEDAFPSPNPMTGRCFMEHPHVLAGRVQLPDANGLSACLEGEDGRDVLALTDTQQRQESLLSASIELRLHQGAPQPGRPADCQLYVRAEQAPNPDSTVTLGSRRDRFGYRRAILRWGVLEQDWDSVVRTVTLVASGLENHYGARTILQIRPDMPWPWDPAGPADGPDATWGNHHLGTTRMADDPAEGVVDRDCRVHGTANLYVAGSSVFPTGSCANPTFMIVALAHRLAEHLSASA
jgi:GMC oxidoreductase